MPEHEKSIDDLVKTIQTIALFIGMGDGHVSDEELEYLDQEAPGYIRYCLKARPAFEALSAGESSEEISSLIPQSINHQVSVGTLFGGPPVWAQEALDARRASEDIAEYEVRFSSALTDPWDQIVAHYFALKMLTFSGDPEQGELEAYMLMLVGWAGQDIDDELIEGLQSTAQELLPSLLGLEPIDLQALTTSDDDAEIDEDDIPIYEDVPAIIMALDEGIESFREAWQKMSPPEPNLDFNGITLLEASVREGDNEITRFLLDNGANPNLRSSDGTTALVSAIATNNLDALELCLGAGAKPDLPSLHDAFSTQGKPTKREITPLGHSAQYNFPEAINALIKAGASVDQRMNNGHTALMTAAMAGNLEATIALLDAGANPDLKPPENIALGGWTPSTPLSCAAREGESEIATLLLERGARVNIADGDGNTALKFFSKAGNDNLVRTLLNSGADPSLVDQEGWSPLMSASYEGCLSTVKILLEAGADANLESSEGLSALDLALEAAQEEVDEDRQSDFAEIVRLLEDFQPAAGGE